MNRPTIIACCLAAALPASAREPAAHVHGTARLQVAVDADALTLSLSSPLANLLGFEHMPRSDKEKAAVRAMADRLNQPALLFVPTLSARCRVESAKLASPVLEPALKGGGHADVDGDFVFRCAQPAALRDIEVELFAVFPRLQRIDVEVATARGQTAARLTPAQPRVSW